MYDNRDSSQFARQLTAGSVLYGADMILIQTRRLQGWASCCVNTQEVPLYYYYYYYYHHHHHHYYYYGSTALRWILATFLVS
jgi:hypothetical protein